jgi:hypothetical protein
VHFSSECTDWFSKKRRLLHLLCITDGNMLVFSYAIRDCIRKLFDKNLSCNINTTIKIELFVVRYARIGICVRE